MNIADWFDLDDPKHIEAYKHLQTVGTWPKDFIPDGIEFGPHWSYMLASKMADRFIAESLRKNPPLPKTLSKKAKAKYLKSPLQCPVCGKNGFDATEPEVMVSGDEAFQHVWCLHCKAKWVDYYVLKDVELVETFD